MITFFQNLQAQRPISMKKENIQSRNRKLSAKARKKHSSFPTMNPHHPGVNPAAASLDMLKPLEKMYGYNAMGMAAAAGMSGMSGMSGMTGMFGMTGMSGMWSKRLSALPPIPLLGLIQCLP